MIFQMPLSAPHPEEMTEKNQFLRLSELNRCSLSDVDQSHNFLGILHIECGQLSVFV